MTRRFLEWTLLITLLLSIGLAVFWADSVVTKRKYDVLRLTNNLYILAANGRATLFQQVNDFDTIQPRIFQRRAFGGLRSLKQESYFDWIIPTLNANYCFVTGEFALPPTPGMGPRAVRYAEFTIPGLSFRRDHDSYLEPRWSLELSLLIPLVLLLVALGLTWRSLRKGRQPRSHGTEPLPQ